MNQETRVNESRIKVDKDEQIKGDNDRLRNIRYKFGYIRKDRNELDEDWWSYSCSKLIMLVKLGDLQELVNLGGGWNIGILWGSMINILQAEKQEKIGEKYR